MGNCRRLETISNNAFMNSDTNTNTDILESINFTNCNRLETIGNDAFSYKNSLKEIIFDGVNKLSKIGDRSFQSSPNLEIIDFTKCIKLEEIGESAFESSGNSKILSLDFSNTKLEKIGENAFFNFSNHDEFSSTSVNTFNISFRGLNNIHLSENSFGGNNSRLSWIDLSELESNANVTTDQNLVNPFSNTLEFVVISKSFNLNGNEVEEGNNNKFGTESYIHKKPTITLNGKY